MPSEPHLLQSLPENRQSPSLIHDAGMQEEEDEAPKPRSYPALLLEVLLTFLLPFLLILAAVAFSGKKNYFYAPGKPQATWPKHPWELTK